MANYKRIKTFICAFFHISHNV